MPDSIIGRVRTLAAAVNVVPPSATNGCGVRGAEKAKDERHELTPPKIIPPK
jgi:hypothetical protein